MTGGQVVKVHGAERVQRTMEAAADDLRDLSGAGDSAGSLVARTAQGFAPRRSGRLASTITATADRESATITAGAGIRYAAVQEYGWPRRHIRASHYMARALDSSQAKVIDTYESAVVKATDQVKGA